MCLEYFSIFMAFLSILLICNALQNHGLVIRNIESHSSAMITINDILGFIFYWSVLKFQTQKCEGLSPYYPKKKTFFNLK